MRRQLLVSAFSRLARTMFVTFAATVLVASVVGDASAGKRGDNPVLRQITSVTTGTVGEPHVKSAHSDTVMFVSDGDVLPSSVVGKREIYEYEKETHILRHLTNTVGGESIDVSRETDEIHTVRPQYTAFISTGEFDPSVGNADGNPELFLKFSETGEYMQLTDTGAGVINSEPYASDTGRCVAFSSTGDLDTNIGDDSREPGRQFSNTDGSQEVFVLRFREPSTFDDRVVTQVSNGPAGTVSGHPVIGGFWFSRQCRSTSYHSTHDQLCNQPEGCQGSTGMHVYNYTKTSGRIQQLSLPGDGISRNPAMSSASPFARGPYTVFESNRDQFGNGSTGFELFRFRLFSTERKQYTWADLGDSQHGTMSDGGGWIGFQSTSELLNPDRIKHGIEGPQNSDHNSEIFRTKGRKRVWQITKSSGCTNHSVSLQDNGNALAFISNCDLIPGSNPNGIEQLFFYDEKKKNHPLLSPANCKVSEGCCNIENGCYTLTFGAKQKVPRPNSGKNFELF